MPCAPCPVWCCLVLQTTVPHCIVGVQILQQLVNEMNQAISEQGLTRHRKVRPRVAAPPGPRLRLFGC